VTQPKEKSPAAPAPAAEAPKVGEDLTTTRDRRQRKIDVDNPFE
jgi:hypothetical protein